VLRVAQIFMHIFTFYFISRLFGRNASAYLAEYGSDYFSFVLVGIAFSQYLSISLNNVAQTIRQEQMMGTLEALLATPTRISTIVIGSSIWDLVFTSFTVVIYLVLGVIFFNADLSHMNLLSAFVVLMLTVISFSSIGILSAAFVMMLKKGDPITWLISSVFGLLGGVYYPIKILPGYLQGISRLLPITYSLHGLRMAVLRGYGIGMIVPDLSALVLYCVLLLPLSIFLFKLAINKAKIDGSLVHY
jgi:ABC-2 type transport system permease protein